MASPEMIGATVTVPCRRKTYGEQLRTTPYSKAAGPRPGGMDRPRWSAFQCPAEPGPAQEPALEEQEAYDRDETGDQHGREEHPKLRLALDRR